MEWCFSGLVVWWFGGWWFCCVVVYLCLVAHPGPSWCTEETMSVMTELHTPLLGPTDMQLLLPDLKCVQNLGLELMQTKVVERITVNRRV